MSTCLSHLGIERGPMLTGSEDSRTDAEMLAAMWAWAEREARGARRKRKDNQKAKKGNNQC